MAGNARSRQLLFGVADAAGNDRAADRVRARLHAETARRQVIGKRIVHDIAWPRKSRGETGARRAQPSPVPSARRSAPASHQQTFGLCPAA